MHPIAFTIFGITVHWYGIMAAVGFLLAQLVMVLNRRYCDMKRGQVENLIFLVAVSGILGARIFYVVQFWDEFRDKPLNIIRIDQGGLVFFGGFIVATAMLLWYCHKHKLKTVGVLDVIAPALALAHACGRIGCFMTGCCYGKPTEAWTGVKYPVFSEAAIRYGNVAVHPVQLYEALWNVVLAVVLFVLVRKASRGVAFSVYLIAYGIWRFVVEFFRGDNALIGGIMTISQWIAVVLIPIGIYCLIWSLKKSRLQDKTAMENKS